MEFDHLPERGRKVDNVMSMVWAGVSLMKLLKEIDKCEVVCANCHKIREHQRRELRRAASEELLEVDADVGTNPLADQQGCDNVGLADYLNHAPKSKRRDKHSKRSRY